MKKFFYISALLMHVTYCIAHEEYTHKHVNFYGCDVSYPMLEWQENKSFYTRRHNIDKKNNRTFKKYKQADASLLMYKDRESSFRFFLGMGGTQYRVAAINFNTTSPYIQNNYSSEDIDYINSQTTKKWFNTALNVQKQICIYHHEDWSYDRYNDVITATFYCKHEPMQLADGSSRDIVSISLVGYYKSIDNVIIRVDSTWAGLENPEDAFSHRKPHTWPVTKETLEDTKRRFNTIEVNCN